MGAPVADSRTVASLTERIAQVLAEAPAAAGFPFGYTYPELAELAYGTDRPSAAQLSAVRRSAARLVHQGRAERIGREDAEDVESRDDFLRRGWHWRTRGDGSSFRALNPGRTVIRRQQTDEERREWEAVLSTAAGREARITEATP